MDLADIEALPIRVKDVKLPVGVQAMKLLIVAHCSHRVGKKLHDLQVIEDSLFFLRMCLDRLDQQPLPRIALANLAPLHRHLLSELVKKSRVLSWTVEAPGVEEAGQGRGVPPCGWDVEGLEGKPDFLR
ncbi:MAG TPA: hypothetical protein VKK31_00230, partial [Thermoanaerobaculia bacterium]|nr:hypothetical protein [Thermoanaerobaculia bacterium]